MQFQLNKVSPTGQTPDSKTVFVMTATESADVAVEGSNSSKMQGPKHLEKDDQGMFFTLLTPVTLKEVMPEPSQPSLFDEFK